MDLKKEIAQTGWNLGLILLVMLFILTVTALAGARAATNSFSLGSASGGKYVTVNVGEPDQFDMYYIAKGDPKNPAIILTPGLGAGSNSWTLLTGKLKNDFYVITYDPRDLYKSSLSGLTPDYEIPALASDLDQLMVKLNIPHAIILGWSMGGPVAEIFAAQHPEKVDALVLMSTVVMATAEECPNLAYCDDECATCTVNTCDVMELMQEEMREKLGIGMEPGTAMTPEEMEEVMLGTIQYSFNNPVLRWIMSRPALIEYAFKDYPHHYEAMAKQISALTKADSLGYVHQIQDEKVLIMHGSADELVPVGYADVIECELYNVAEDDKYITIIDGGSHGMSLENASKVAKGLNAFFDEIGY